MLQFVGATAVMMMIGNTNSQQSASSPLSSSQYDPHWALYPKSYVARRYAPTSTTSSSDAPFIDQLDGNLDKEAWRTVEWSDNFGDIQGPKEARRDAFKPSTTKFKAMWDDTYLYIGALLEPSSDFGPTQAHFTERNSPIFQRDSDFEVFVDWHGSCHEYKELEVNALNVVWNLCLDKPYKDGGSEHSGRVAQPDQPQYWDAKNQKTAVRVVKGQLNDSSGKQATWSVEIALSFKDLKEHLPASPSIARETMTTRCVPSVPKFLRVNFSRVELRGRVNWTWQPQIVWDPERQGHHGFVDMHLPDAWGYFVLSRNDEPDDSVEQYRDPSWPARLAAMNVYYALHHYKETSPTKSFTSDLSQLLLDDEIVAPFDIAVALVLPSSRDHKDDSNRGGFVVTVRSLEGVVVTVRDDRFVAVVALPRNEQQSKKEE